MSKNFFPVIAAISAPRAPKVTSVSAPVLALTGGGETVTDAVALALTFAFDCDTEFTVAVSVATPGD